MTAAVHQGGRFAVAVEEQHQLLAQQREGFRAVLQVVEPLGRVPEAAEDLLAGGEHGQILLSSSSLGREELDQRFRLPFAVVPAPERPGAQAGHGEEQDDAGGGDEKQRCEHAGDVEFEARLQDLVSETGAPATRAGHGFGHDRADQRKAARDAQPCEEIRKGARDAQANERLQAARLVDGEEVLQARVDGAKPERGVRDDREQRHQRGAEDQRHLRVLDQDDDERRDRHHRGHLQHDRIGEQAALDGPALHEEEGRHDSDHHGEQERDQRHLQGAAEGAEQSRRILEEDAGDDARRRQQELRHVEDAAGRFPHRQ